MLGPNRKEPLQVAGDIQERVGAERPSERVKDSQGQLGGTLSTKLMGERSARQ